MQFNTMICRVHSWDEAFAALSACGSFTDAARVHKGESPPPEMVVAELYWNKQQEMRGREVSLSVVGTEVEYTTSGGLSFGWRVRVSKEGKETWYVWVQHPDGFYGGSSLFWALAQAGFEGMDDDRNRLGAAEPDWDPIRSPEAVERAHASALYAAKNLPHITPDLSGGVYDPAADDDEDDEYSLDEALERAEEAFLGESTLAKLRDTNLFDE